jgi:CubicO group peptidase (beta-lactamase class C family)
MIRTFGKWLGRTLLALLLFGAALAIWKWDEINRLLAVNSLFDPDKIVQNFSNMDSVFLSVPIDRGTGPQSDLPQGAPLDLPDGFDAWTERRSVTGFLLLHNGQIRHEAYLRGTKDTDLRIGWSISKSYISAILGILLETGTITSLDDRAADYVLQLAGSAYDSVTIRDLLQMTSGVTFDEDYLDPKSDINKMGRTLALGGRMDDFAAGLTEITSAPGTKWKYTSIDTHVLAMVLRAASGKSLPDLLSQHIVEKLGQAQNGIFLTDGVGVAFALGGINMTLRDYARFGQMILQNGQWQGQQIVPRNWLAFSTQPNGLTDPGEVQFGAHWWMPADAKPGEFMGRGIYGQYIYINKPAGVVIVTTAADLTFREDGAREDNVAMFRKVIDALED